MATEKSINARVVMKTDTEANWAKAVNFIPKKGEVIVYSGNPPKIKVGDGTTKVNALPFMTTAITNDEIDTICGASIQSASEVYV